MKRLTKLTPEQHDRMASFAQEWIQHGWRTSPLTEEEWAVWEAGARRCYEFAGIPWPGVVVRVPSPIVGAFAAPIADILIGRIKRGDAVRDAVGDAVGGAVGDAVGGAVDGAVDGAVGGAVGGAVRGAVDGAVGDAVGDAVDGAVRGAVGDAVGGAVRGAVDGAVRDAVDGAVDDAVGGAVRGAVDGAVRDAVGDAVDGAVRGAVGDAVGGAVRGAVDGAVDGAVGGAVDDAVGGAVGDAVDGAVDDAVRDAVDDAVRDAVDDAVRDAVRGAVDGAVDGAVGDAVDGAVDGAVRGAVDGAVRDAVDGAEIRQNILDRWYYRLGGRHWAGWWQSYVAFFRDIVELRLGGDIWDRSRAYEDAQSAGWWWPFRDFIMVCDVPTTLHVEQVGPTGWGSHRLHCEDGPAVAWADGWGVYSWHGTRVPGWVVDGTATIDTIMQERNAEVRRCAIEAFGWDRFADRLTLVAEADDPGNAPHKISLYDLPRELNLYPEPARILLVTNGSVERDGTRRRFGLPVPAHHNDPITAAADLVGWPRAAYAALEVRR